MNKHSSHISTPYPPHDTTNPLLVFHILISIGVTWQIILLGGRGVVEGHNKSWDLLTVN